MQAVAPRACVLERSRAPSPRGWNDSVDPIGPSRQFHRKEPADLAVWELDRSIGCRNRAYVLEKSERLRPRRRTHARGGAGELSGGGRLGAGARRAAALHGRAGTADPRLKRRAPTPRKSLALHLCAHPSHGYAAPLPAQGRHGFARLSEEPRRLANASSPRCAPTVTRCPPTMRARTWCWSTPAASSIQRQGGDRSRRSARRSPRTAASSSPGAWARKPSSIRARFPNVLADHRRASNMTQVVERGPRGRADAARSPYPRSGPRRRHQGHRPQAHPAALQLPEDLRGLQPPLQPSASSRSLRGDLVSRRPDAILREAEKLVAAGTKELLVISQDTSAYGIDIRREPRDVEGSRGRSPT